MSDNKAYNDDIIELKEIVCQLKSRLTKLEEILYSRTYCDISPPSYTLEEYIYRINLTTSDLWFVLKNDITSFVLKTIKSNKETLPIILKTDRESSYPSQLIVFDDTNRWIEYTEMHSEIIFKLLHKKILSLFTKWQSDNIENIVTNSLAIETYVHKILFQNDNIYKDIHNCVINKVYNISKIV